MALAARRGLCLPAVLALPVLLSLAGQVRAQAVAGAQVNAAAQVDAGAQASAVARVDLPAPDKTSLLVISAERASRWTEGAYDVWHLQGQCILEQGHTRARAAEAVLWIHRDANEEEGRHKVIAYLEGQVTVDYLDTAGRPNPLARIQDKSWLGRFYSDHEPSVHAPSPSPEPQIKPATYERGSLARNPPPDAQQVQFEAVEDPVPRSDAPPPGTYRIRLLPRSGVPLRAQEFPNPAANETVVLVDSGINLLVDGLPGVSLVDLVADRAVIWIGTKDISLLAGDAALRADVPVEIYLEGNIVFRQGQRVIYAERMYYDVTRSAGIILDTELLAPVPLYQGTLRVRTEVLQQLNESRFVARNALITSSRLGIPRYWLSASDVSLVLNQIPVVDPTTGLPQVEPDGDPVIVHERTATSQNNVLYLAGVPILYWPILASELEEPIFYIERARIRNDRIFGTQILTDWNTYEVFGILNPPEGTDWEFTVDYLSERGLGLGTNFRYNRPNLFGYGGPAAGFIDVWGILDQGVDVLGLDRMELVPEEELRGRVFGRHRQELPNEFELTAQLGLISDRNFLEQFFENEWDQFPDQETSIELKQRIGNQSWDIEAQLRLNEFFTETERLPELEHFWLGQPILYDTLTWYEHSSLGYLRLETASVPTDPRDAARFELLPWEVEQEGLRAVTRQELDFPILAGPVKLVPFTLGEAGYWGSDIMGDEITRLYGKVGVRAALPMWSVDPTIESDLFNVHGLAHKVTWHGEASHSEATQDLMEFPLYDQLDDNAQEHFRRRFAFNTFGGPPIPLRFDERFFAFRSGLQNLVTSPSFEIVDDRTAVTLGAHQRWQTKRGPLGRRRIIDWMEFDTEATYFPNDERDNFGEPIGLINYDFRWHVGDRTTLMSEGFFDTFPDAGQVVTVGAFLNRPPRGSLFLGFTSIEGPIESQVVSAWYSYLMSPKWVSTAGAAIALQDTSNIGQSFSITRIGESFLVSLGANVDTAKDNVGVTFAIEPRFLPFSAIGRTLGVGAPIGRLGLE